MITYHRPSTLKSDVKVLQDRSVLEVRPALGHSSHKTALQIEKAIYAICVATEGLDCVGHHDQMHRYDVF